MLAECEKSFFEFESFLVCNKLRSWGRNDGSSSVLAEWDSRGRWIQRLTDFILGDCQYFVRCRMLSFGVEEVPLYADFWRLLVGGHW